MYYHTELSHLLDKVHTVGTTLVKHYKDAQKQQLGMCMPNKRTV